MTVLSAPPRLDHPVFAGVFVLVTPALALLVGLCAVFWPAAWPWLLAIDLWLLSFPHVASTFTRTAFRRDDARDHRGILFALPFAALALSAGVVLGGGLRALNTVYFFAQTYHYTRQSRGIHRALRRAAGRPAQDPLSDAVMYLVALWTLVHRCAQGPVTFFGVALWVPTLSRGVELVALSAAMVAMTLWVVRVVRASMHEESGRDVFHQLHVLGHVALFVVSYVAITDATRGWLAINLWHNAQYLMFVRAWNYRRFAPQATSDGLLATISRPAGSLAFFAVCAALGAVGYGAIERLSGLGALSLGVLPLYLIMVHAVNFHHYTADAILWRAPRPRRAEAC